MADPVADPVEHMAIGSTGAGPSPGQYQPARVVQPPSGRARAARVAESGTIGPRRRDHVVVVPADDLLQRHVAGMTSCPDPTAAFRELLASCMQTNGESSQGSDDPVNPILADGGFVWFALAGENRTPVGCVALNKRIIPDDGAGVSPAWELTDLAVRSSHRRQGVGTQLVEAVLRQAGEVAGPDDKVFLEMPPACEQVALALFTKTGFVLETEEEIACGPQRRVPDAVRMCNRSVRRREA